MSRTYYFVVLLAAVRTSDALLRRVADGNVSSFCVCSVFGLFARMLLSTPLGSIVALTSFELHSCKPSAITCSLRGAAGGRQPAAAMSPLYILLVFIVISEYQVSTP